jgi:hypothetical protein
MPNDEYAVLMIDGIQIFYKRVSNKWLIDRTVKQSFFINNNKLFCNINNKCIKNEKTKTCDSITEHKNVYVAEFNARLSDLDDKLLIDNCLIQPYGTILEYSFFLKTLTLPRE